MNGTFFKALVAMELYSPFFGTEFQMNMFRRQVCHVKHLRGYERLFSKLILVDSLINYISFNDFTLKIV